MRLDDIHDSDEAERGLLRLLGPRFLHLLRAWHQWVADQLQLSVEDFRLDDPSTRKQLALAAERVVLINQGTRNELRKVLQEGQRRGYSNHEMANGVPAEGFGGVEAVKLSARSRAETVARTEIATAQVAAGLDRYAATGLVDYVKIVEHEDTDAPCAERNGRVVPIASRPGLKHPNCQMSYVPIVRQDAA